jgi:hypothetical protein
VRLLVAALVVAAPALASADPTVITDQPAQLELPTGWRAEAGPAVADGPVLVVRGPGGALGAVSVAMAPNPDAWRDQTRDANVDGIVEGFDAQPGVRVKKRTLSKVGIVPCLDLELRRDGKRVAVRLLLFRTRTIALVIEGASSASLLVPTPQ